MGLALIMVLSILVLSSAKTTVLQQKMSANLKDKELAFQSAESALMTGETYLRDAAKEELAGNFSDSNGLFLYDKNRDLKSEADWSEIDSIDVPIPNQVVSVPEYIIEELPEIEVEGDSLIIPRPVSNQHFRITSKAKGGTNASLSVHQIMFKK